MASVSTSAAGRRPARLTEEQVLLRDAVRELADEQVAPRAAEIDRTGEWPDDIRRLLADHDIFAIPFAEAHGGLGADLLTLCLAIEQLSRALRHDRPDPRRPGAGRDPDPGRGHAGAAGSLAAGPRVGREADRVRA